MRIAVLGAGGGGLAVAYEWASQGHEVALYAQHAHEHHLVPVRERGGIQAEGKLEGFVSLATVTTRAGARVTSSYSRAATTTAVTSSDR